MKEINVYVTINLISSFVMDETLVCGSRFEFEHRHVSSIIMIVVLIKEQIHVWTWLQQSSDLKTVNLDKFC